MLTSFGTLNKDIKKILGRSQECLSRTQIFNDSSRSNVCLGKKDYPSLLDGLTVLIMT
uniref:Uncharacterized protein n=1 Tax=Romanomermis culicivorax TaxID=13658 RepID=A0A915JAX9_ROMCU